MLIGEPPRTQADINFVLLGFPVRIHPFFWVVGLVLGLNNATDPTPLFMWVGVLLISILVHELGHALAMRYFGVGARIVLHGMGGLAIPESSPYSTDYNESWRQPKHWILICLAGPGAGFVLAAVVVALVFALGGEVQPRWSTMKYPIPWTVVIVNAKLHLFVWDMLVFNVIWGLVNLCPVYPLDGGQISRELFTLAHARDGIKNSLSLSMMTAIGLAVFGLVIFQSLFMAILFGFMAYSSYQALQAYTRHSGGPGGGGFGGGGYDGDSGGGNRW